MLEALSNLGHVYMCVGETWQCDTGKLDLSSVTVCELLDVGDTPYGQDAATCRNAYRFCLWMGGIEREELTDEDGFGRSRLRSKWRKNRSGRPSNHCEKKHHRGTESGHPKANL
jgi:hypothetical protein